MPIFAHFWYFIVLDFVAFETLKFESNNVANSIMISPPLNVGFFPIWEILETECKLEGKNFNFFFKVQFLVTFETTMLYLKELNWIELKAKCLPFGTTININIYMGLHTTSSEHSSNDILTFTFFLKKLTSYLEIEKLIETHGLYF